MELDSTPDTHTVSGFNEVSRVSMESGFDSWVTSSMPASIKLYRQWEQAHCREICLTPEQLWGKRMGKAQ